MENYWEIEPQLSSGCLVPLGQQHHELERWGHAVEAPG